MDAIDLLREAYEKIYGVGSCDAQSDIPDTNSFGTPYSSGMKYLTEGFSGHVAYCIKDGYVYSGITPNCNSIFNIQGNHVYRGITRGGIPAYTIGPDGHIWEGMFASGNCIGRIADGFVHLGGYNACSSSFKIQDA